MRLTELLEQGGLPEGSEELLRGEALSPDEVKRILGRTLEKAGIAAPEKGKGKAMKRSRFALCLLAGVVCAGAVVASAAAYFQLDSRMARTLGAESEGRQSLLRESGNAIQTSQESQGWTLTVNQAVGDRNCSYLLLDLTAPEGTALDADYYLMDDLLPVFERDADGGWGWECLEDEDKTDNKISFLLNMSRSSDLRSAKGILRAKGVRAVRFGLEGSGNDQVERLVEAQWEVPFQLDYRDQVTTCRPKQTVELEKGRIKGSVTVEKVELTPLSMAVTFSGGEDILEQLDALSPDWPLLEGEIPLEVRDREGNLLYFHSSSDRKRGNRTEKVLIFSRSIDPADVAALVIDGIEVPLN